jgi:putative endonuclease
MLSSDSGKPAESGKHAKGRRYEQRAAQFYRDNGFEILDQNWRAGHKEIDLIVRKGRLVAFVEVKSAGSGAFGHPAEKIDKSKRQNLIHAARRYLIEKDMRASDLRFDVVTFFEGKLEHFPDAFTVE